MQCPVECRSNSIHPGTAKHLVMDGGERRTIIHSPLSTLHSRLRLVRVSSSASNHQSHPPSSTHCDTDETPRWTWEINLEASIIILPHFTVICTGHGLNYTSTQTILCYLPEPIVRPICPVTTASPPPISPVHTFSTNSHAQSWPVFAVQIAILRDSSPPSRALLVLRNPIWAAPKIPSNDSARPSSRSYEIQRVDSTAEM